jgi:hypothetical protein
MQKMINHNVIGSKEKSYLNDEGRQKETKKMMHNLDPRKVR